MRLLLEAAHNAMHGFVNMGGRHISFRDPFVFFLHSGQDWIYSRRTHVGELVVAVVARAYIGDTKRGDAARRLRR